jgi:hypothetical protein
MLCLAVGWLVAGCGGSSPPFFVVQNNQTGPVHAIYCTTLNCQHAEADTLPAGGSGRFINVTGDHSAGVLRVTLAGRPSGCTAVPPAVLMVDHLFVYQVSSLLVSGCAGYNPGRPLGLPRPASRR